MANLSPEELRQRLVLNRDDDVDDDPETGGDDKADDGTRADDAHAAQTAAHALLGREHAKLLDDDAHDIGAALSLDDRLCGGIALRFDRVSARVAAPTKRTPKRTRRVLASVGGGVAPGEMLALMGASGSGKTTLLQILAGRPQLGERGEWSGAVTLDGAPPPPGWRREVAFVLQKDLLDEVCVEIEEEKSAVCVGRFASVWREHHSSRVRARDVQLLARR